MGIDRCSNASAPISSPSELISHTQHFLIAKMLVLLLLTLPGYAQNGAGIGQITGVVKDPSQAVVAGTLLVLTNQQTKVKITVVTDGQGLYTFPSLQPGIYVVEVNAKGFQPAVSAELKVAAGQTVNSDFALALAG